MDAIIPESVKQHCEKIYQCLKGDPFQVSREAPTTPECTLKMQKEVRSLAKEREAVILAHNYQDPAIQDIADYVGDSLGLAREAAKTSAPVIIFCGVLFMAETAKILNPERTVLVPDVLRGCSLDFASEHYEDLISIKKQHPELFVVSYVNCSAQIKALSDVICTSGNAVKIIRACPLNRPILFLPDQFLGSWVAKQTGRTVGKDFFLWPGYCYVHRLFTPENIQAVKSQHPAAKIVSHPECTQAVKDISDEVCSTEKMIAYCKSGVAQEFIIVTEVNMIHRLRKECPGKQLYSVPVQGFQPECRFMRWCSLEKIRNCLQKMDLKVDLNEEVMDKARLPIQRMLDWS